MSFENLQRLLERSNPGLPQGSLRVISVVRGGSAPRFFAEATEEGHAYLLGRDFTLATITSPVVLRPIGGDKGKSSSE